MRLLVVSDGSTDTTCEIVEGYGRGEAKSGIEARVQLLAYPQRRGKAACLNDAVASCTEEIIVFTDVRQRLDVLAVRSLVDNFADTDVGAASGQLMFERDNITEFGESMDAYWRYEKFLRMTESAIHSSVGVTGAIYALRRDCFRPIPDDTLLDDVLIPMNVVLQRKRVLFEKNALAFDLPSRDVAQERIRKVRTLAGNFQLIWRYPKLLLPWCDPIAWQFVSHKLMRLVSPLALVAALLSNVILARGSWFFTFTLSAQLVCYFLAVAGSLFMIANRFRVVKLAAAFVSLNWFVVLGFIEFVSNRDAHLWKNTPISSKNN